MNGRNGCFILFSQVLVCVNCKLLYIVFNGSCQCHYRDVQTFKYHHKYKTDKNLTASCLTSFLQTTYHVSCIKCTLDESRCLICNVLDLLGVQVSILINQSLFAMYRCCFTTFCASFPWRNIHRWSW